MKQKKTNRFDIRLTEKDYNRIKLLANMYAGGNINLWLTHGGLNAPRTFLKDDLGIQEIFNKNQIKKARTEARAKK